MLATAGSSAARLQAGAPAARRAPRRAAPAAAAASQPRRVAAYASVRADGPATRAREQPVLAADALRHPRRGALLGAAGVVAAAALGVLPAAAPLPAAAAAAEPEVTQRVFLDLTGASALVHRPRARQPARAAEARPARRPACGS
jgi:hypothetical protein